MALTFHVKNFDRLQHYKDRSPPWIKLYNGLLDDYDFAALPDASKAHLLAIGLLASRYTNKIPLDADWVGKRINATEAVNFDVLIKSGFIIPDQPCSEPLAERLQVAIPERETEKRQSREETEKKEVRASRVVTPVEPHSIPPPKPKRKARTSLPENFPDDDAMNDALQFWRVHARFDLQPVQEMVKFRAHHTAHGNTMADWPAAWRTWFHNALQFNRQPKASNHDKGTQGAALYLASLEAGDRARPGDGAGTLGDPFPENGHGLAQVGGPVRNLR